MQELELKIKKLILKFSVRYYELREINKKFFSAYLIYCLFLTRDYKDKFSGKNAISTTILNYNNFFSDGNDQKNINDSTKLHPFDFLTSELDYTDPILLEYFENLII